MTGAHAGLVNNRDDVLGRRRRLRSTGQGGRFRMDAGRTKGWAGGRPPLMRRLRTTLSASSTPQSKQGHHPFAWYKRSEACCVSCKHLHLPNEDSQSSCPLPERVTSDLPASTRALGSQRRRKLLRSLPIEQTLAKSTVSLALLPTL